MNVPARIGRFQIIRRLGKSMNEVYLALDTEAGRKVALKLIPEGDDTARKLVVEAERRSASAFQLKEGTLYPALHQMERSGLLKARWSEGEQRRSRKYYSLTAKGRRRAESKRRQWGQISAAMRAIIGDAHA